MKNAVGERIEKAVVDTGPLLSALIINYARQSPQQARLSILRQSRISSYLENSVRKQDALLLLLTGIPVILTTSHVIAELQGLQKLKGDHKEMFWLRSMEFVNQKRLGEKAPLTIVEMYNAESLRDLVSEIGPTDTGLIELARQEDCTLLTEDERTPAPKAWGLSVDCRVVQKIIP